jgi:hemerythrin-like metal-binding protein
MAPSSWSERTPERFERSSGLSEAGLNVLLEKVRWLGVEADFVRATVESRLARILLMPWYSLRVNLAPATRSARPLVGWRRPLETGLASIDQQHRELFEALSGLAATIEADRGGKLLDEALAALARHLIKHCQTEETLMKEAGLPDRIAHAAQHQEVVLRVRDLQYRRTKGQPMGLEAVASLGAWLDRHIDESDRAMAGHLKALRAN